MVGKHPLSNSSKLNKQTKAAGRWLGEGEVMNDESQTKSEKCVCVCVCVCVVTTLCIRNGDDNE